MVQDYAKRMTSSRKPPKRRGKITLIIVIILLAIAIPMAMVVVHHRTALRQPSLAAKTTKAPSPKPTSKKVSTHNQFDFYTVLPKMRVETPPSHQNSSTQGG